MPKIKETLRSICFIKLIVRPRGSRQAEYHNFSSF